MKNNKGAWIVASVMSIGICSCVIMLDNTKLLWWLVVPLIALAVERENMK